MSSKPREPRRSAKAPSSSQASIAKLKAQGMNNSQIGRAIGRDSSLIGQIAAGKKPGVNLASALDALTRGVKPKPPERRKTKEGHKAKTRQVFVDMKMKGIKAFISRIEKIANDGGKVNVVSRWTTIMIDGYSGLLNGAGMVSLYGGRGRGSDPNKILRAAKRYAKVHADKSDRELLEGFLQSQLKASFRGVNKADKGYGRLDRYVGVVGLQGLEIHAIPSKIKRAKS